MKKILSLIFLSILLLSLCACALPGEEAETTVPAATEAPGTWTLFETVFMPIARGEIAPEMDAVLGHLDSLGYYEWPTTEIFEGIITVWDPENPRSYLSAAFPDGGSLGEMTYHYVIRDAVDMTYGIQRVAMVRFPYGVAQYFTHGDLQGNGTPADSPEALAEYIMFPGLLPEETLPEGVADPILNSYRNVLLGREPFVERYSGQPMTVDPMTWTISDSFGRSPILFTLVDLDNDGARELILWLRQDGDNYGGFWTLRSEGGQVWGYESSYRCYDQLKEDGTYASSVSAYEHGLGRPRFTVDDCVFDYSAKYEAAPGEDGEPVDERYYIGGEEVTQADLDAAYAAHREKPDARWLSFLEPNLVQAGLLLEGELGRPSTEENLARILLEDGSFYSREHFRHMTLRDYEQAAGQSAFRAAAVDLDGDGIREAVLELGDSGDMLILRDTGAQVEGILRHDYEVSDLKADGTFCFYGKHQSQGIRAMGPHESMDRELAFRDPMAGYAGTAPIVFADTAAFGIPGEVSQEDAFRLAWEIQKEKEGAAWVDRGNWDKLFG